MRTQTAEHGWNERPVNEVNRDEYKQHKDIIIVYKHKYTIRY
ncbi:hypothetical protein SAMN05518855_1001141 [Paenibacillus sp. CF384]|nr:hypothetical protein SAMN05518855_1001141 [Paenibacillus sp. CF384]